MPATLVLLDLVVGTRLSSVRRDRDMRFAMWTFTKKPPYPHHTLHILESYHKNALWSRISDVSSITPMCNMQVWEVCCGEESCICHPHIYHPLAHLTPTPPCKEQSLTNKGVRTTSSMQYPIPSSEQLTRSATSH